MFFQYIMDKNTVNDTLSQLYAVVEGRKTEGKEGSYTAYLFDKGLDKILKKVGEECTETIIAAKNGEKSAIIEETADLLYHLTVMLCSAGLPWSEVLKELDKRTEKIGNLKAMRDTDRQS